MGCMASLLDTPEGVGDPAPQLPPPEQSPGVVENPEQSPLLPSVRLRGRARCTLDTTSLLPRAPPQLLTCPMCYEKAENEMHSTCTKAGRELGNEARHCSIPQ